MFNMPEATGSCQLSTKEEITHREPPWALCWREMVKANMIMMTGKYYSSSELNEITLMYPQ